MGKFFRNLLIVLLLLVLALGAAILLAPRFLDRAPEPVAGNMDGAAIVLTGDALLSPDTSPEQSVETTADGLLRIVVLANQPLPTPAERGVRVVLTPERAAMIDGVPVVAEVRYAAPDAGAATGLAVSLQGIGPSEWVRQPIGPEGAARFELPAQMATNAIGLRALTDATDATGALVISEIRLTPAAP